MSRSSNVKVRTRCPACRSMYTVPAAFVGHHARCTKCRARFVVNEYNPHPTEEDILRWLNESNDDNEFSHSPRVVTHLPHPAPTTAPGASPTDRPQTEAVTPTPAET